MLAEEKAVKAPAAVTIDIDKKSRTSWVAGFLTILFLIFFITIYTFYVKDLTVYNLFILLITFYTMGSMAVSMFFKTPVPVALRKDYNPFVSLLIPAKNEEKVIEKTIRSLFGIDYHLDGLRNYEVIVINDDSSDATQEILEKLKAEFPELIPLRRIDGKKGKSAVLNYAIPFAKGEILAVFDADSLVGPDFLEKCIPYFFDESIVGVQSRVRIFNSEENFLTKFQDDEFSVFAHMLQVSKSIYGGIMQLAGNGQLTRKNAVIDAGGWNENSSTDDQDLTLQFLLKSKFVQYSPEAVVWQEAVTKPAPFMRQRIRWAEGMLRCVFDYFYPVMFSPRLTLLQKVDGLSGLMRIVATLVVIIGYVQFLLALLTNTVFYCDPVVDIMSKVVFIPLFLLVMAGGIWKYTDNVVFKDVLRVPFYWAYNVFWLFAAPIGFYNSFKNRNSIEWDKTEHSG